MQPVSQRSIMAGEAYSPSSVARDCLIGRVRPNPPSVGNPFAPIPPLTEGGDNGQAAPALGVRVSFAGFQVERALIPCFDYKGLPVASSRRVMGGRSGSITEASAAFVINSETIQAASSASARKPHS